VNTEIPAPDAPEPEPMPGGVGPFGEAADGEAPFGEAADGEAPEGAADDAYEPDPVADDRWIGSRWDVPAEAPDPVDRPRNRVLVGAGVAVVVALLGVPLAWIWSAVAPWLPARLSGGELFYADPEGEQRAGAEGWFILLTIGTGILVALITWFALRRFRGSVMIAALAIGSTAAGWITWRIGHNIGKSAAMDKARHAADGSIIRLPPDLRARTGGNIAYWHHVPYFGGDLLYMAVAAVATYVVIVAFSVSPGLNRRKQVEPATMDA
jgi:hypothetical protein